MSEGIESMADAIDTLSSKVDLIPPKIDTINTSVTNVNTNVAAVTTAINSLRTDVATMSSNLTAIKDSLTQPKKISIEQFMRFLYLYKDELTPRYIDYGNFIVYETTTSGVNTYDFSNLNNTDITKSLITYTNYLQLFLKQFVPIPNFPASHHLVTNVLFVVAGFTGTSDDNAYFYVFSEGALVRSVPSYELNGTSNISSIYNFENIGYNQIRITFYRSNNSSTYVIYNYMTNAISQS